MPRKYYKKRRPKRRNKPWKRLKKAWGGSGTRLSMFLGTGLPARITTTLVGVNTFRMSSAGSGAYQVASVLAGSCYSPWTVPPATREPAYFDFYKQIYNDHYVLASKIVVKCTVVKPTPSAADAAIITVVPSRGTVGASEQLTDAERPRGLYRLVTYSNPTSRIVNYAKTSAIVTNTGYRKPMKTAQPPSADDLENLWSWYIQCGKPDYSSVVQDISVVWVDVSVEVYYRVVFSERRLIPNPDPPIGPD